MGCSPSRLSEIAEVAPEQHVSYFEPNFEPGIVRVLDAEAHQTSLSLRKNEALRLEVEQLGTDLVIDVLDDAGHHVLTVDSPIEGYGPEFLCFVAPRSATYQVKIRGFSEPSTGTYRLHLAHPRPATAEDHACAEALALFFEVEARRQLPDNHPQDLLPTYARTAELLRQTDLGYSLGVTLTQFGYVLADLGHLEESEAALGEALELFQVEEDSRQETRLSNYLGLVLRGLGKLHEAQRHFEKARRLAQQHEDLGSQASALNNLGLLYQTQGRQHRAIEHFERALELGRQVGNPREEAIFLLNHGISQARLAELDTAVQSMGRALERIRQGPLDRPAHLLISEIEIELAWTLQLAEQPGRALGLLINALERNRGLEHATGQAFALDRIGTVLRQQGQFGAALKVYRESQRILDELDNPRDLAAVQANIGWLFLSWNRSSEALTELRQAMTVFESIGDRPSQADAMVGLAHVARRHGRLAQALEYLEKALQLTEELQTEGGRLGDRFRSIPLWQSYQDFHVDLLVELHRRQPDDGYDARAFEVSDRSRARGLYEMLLEADVNVRAQVPEALLDKEEAVLARLLALEDRLLGLRAQGGSGASFENLELQYDALHQEVERSQMAVRASSEPFQNLRHPQPLKTERIFELLEPGSTLISFDLGEHGSHLFLVANGRLTVHPLPPRREIEYLALAYWRSISQPENSFFREQMQALGERLSEILLSPVATELEDSRLVVIGDGVLHYVPFATLPLPGQTEPMMVRRHEVVNLPSVSVIERLRYRANSRPLPDQSVAIIADPVFGKPEYSPGLVDTNAGTGDLIPLPHTRREAESILGYVEDADALLALDFEATAELIQGDVLHRYGIVHIATHAIIDERDPRLSGIALAMYGPQGQELDGFLSLSEIYRLELAADLVVLSGCRTALGEHVKGVGLLGLTRGFFYAGASRLLVSLWDVNDEATSVLMDHFYQALLQEGLSPPQSLRKAQLRMLEDERWNSPYFWAGFVLQGDFAPLRLTNITKELS